ncbi:MAG TPA: cell division protein FtsZ, partial [Microbacterium ginsengisoli]|nr:cell division protein FtsZ [Microbacterium ginsengisoli]
EPSPRLEPVLGSARAAAPAVPAAAAATDEPRDDEASFAVPVHAGISDPAPYDSAFGEDDLDIPDFLK